MYQAIKEELVHTLDRLSLEKLCALLRFARSLERQAAEQATDAAGGSDGEAERALTDFIIAAGCGQSGDPNSALRVDEVLYSHPNTP